MSAPSLTGALQETLALFDERGQPKTTSEVAEQLDLGRRSTYDRLDRLVDHGELETKKVGGNGRVWWRPLADDHTAPDSARDVRHEQFDQLVEAIGEYAILTLDADGCVRTWNDGAERITGYESEEILGRSVSALYTEEDREAGVPEQTLARAEQRPVETSGWRTRKDGSRFWAQATTTAVREDGDLQGFLKVTRDMTQRREYQSALKEQSIRLRKQRDELESELDKMFERISDGFYALDEQLRFLYLNDHAMDVLGLDESAIGKRFLESVTVTDTFREALAEACETQESVSFEDYYDPVDRWFYNAIYPSEDGVSVYFREITERKERQQELERATSRLEALFEHSPDMIDTLDREGRILDANHRFCEELGYEKREVLGMPIWEIDQEVDSDDVKALLSGFEPDERRKFEGVYERSDGSTLPVEVHLLRLRLAGEDRFLAISRDITERTEREEALREAKTQLEAATTAGEVGTWVWNVPENQLIVDSWLADMYGDDPDAASDGVPLEAFTSRVHEADSGHVEAAINRALSRCGEYEMEYRVRDVDDDIRWVIARGTVECDDDGNALRFPGTLTDITQRKHAERELERQREKLAALNNLNEIVRDVTGAVIEQPRREEIEQIVCDRLAQADSYEFAWIGDVDINSETVELRAEAGVDGCFHDGTISVDPDDEHSHGPITRALQAGEIQTTEIAAADSGDGPWPEQASEHGFRSSVAIPLVYEETIYGVLNVYAERPNAFEKPERQVISQLGEIVGHAIAAADRKQALMSDEVTEIEFLLTDISDAFGLESELEGAITITRTIPLGDGTYLQYWTGDMETVEALQSLVEEVPYSRGVRVIDQRSDRVRYEFRLSDPPITSTIASQGAAIQQAKIENDELHLTVHHPPSVSSRQIIDAVKEPFPNAKLQARRQVTREHEPLESFYQTVTSELTGRQQAALEAATYSGFFEWPREASGEDVADSLGIASPTFSQHLRKAEKKVFETLFLDS